jgi:hypothetical protein
MRIPLHVIAIFKCAGLSLIGVDRHQPWSGILTHDAPLTPGRKSSAAQSPQSRVIQRLGDGLEFTLTVDTGTQQRVTLVGHISVKVTVLGNFRMHVPAFDSRRNVFDAGVVHVIMADFRHWCRIATTHARCAHNAEAVTGFFLQCFEQLARAHHLAGDAVADTHGDCRRQRFTFSQNVEVGVEGRGLIDLGHWKAHFLRQRRQVLRRYAVMRILYQVQILDQ